MALEIDRHKDQNHGCLWRGNQDHTAEDGQDRLTAALLSGPLGALMLGNF